MKKGQSAVEFMIILASVLFLLVFFVLVFYNSYGDTVRENRNKALFDIALDVQNEIALASEAGDGYARGFTLPTNVYGRNYTMIVVDGNFLYIETSDHSSALGISVLNATGTFIPGFNLILNQEGVIRVNS